MKRIIVLWSVLTFSLACLPILSSVSAQAPEEKMTELEKQVRILKQTVDEIQRLVPTREPQPAKTNSPATPSVEPTNAQASSTPSDSTKDVIARIREEGLQHSQVMQTLGYLTDIIGPRLTGSANLKRANEWTREKMTSWGLTNSHLEAWGPFGRGWVLKRFSAQIIEPQDIPLIGFPAAWSPGLDKPITAEVVYFDTRNESSWEKYKGKLKGAVVLAGSPRDVQAHFEPLATRLTETNLLRLANAPAPRSRSGPPAANRGRTNSLLALATSLFNPAATPDTDQPSARAQQRPAPNSPAANPAVGATNANPSVSRAENRPAPRSRPAVSRGYLSFLAREGVALVVSPSPQGDGGTYFVSSAMVPPPDEPPTNSPANSARLSPWATNAPPMPAQIVLTTEDYNRLVHMIQQGENLKMAVDLQVQFLNDDPMAYNTVAEIPGSDLPNEVVMLGGHLDSWHAGTGATDDGAGVAVAMEAVRILEALKLKPRRTIRVGLWSGEEQGLLGSKAYVGQHFGYYTNITNAITSGSGKASGKEGNPAPTVSVNSTSSRQLVRGKEYEQFSAYFNFDNGTGKIRGVYLQGNEGVRSLFRRWLEPFADLGAETLTLSNTGGTDHLPFDAIGLPGFQFIQDPIDYMSRTHHSNADVLDRIQAADLKQAAVIMAAFVYNTAMLDEKLPRKPTDRDGR